MVVDNEAGMEHLSRRTSGKVDMLYLVTDYSLRGLRALRRIHGLLEGLKLSVKKMGIVVTRGPEKLSDVFLAEAKEIGIPPAGTAQRLNNFSSTCIYLLDPFLLLVSVLFSTRASLFQLLLWDFCFITYNKSIIVSRLLCFC